MSVDLNKLDLSKLELKVSDIFESMPHGIIISERYGTIVMCNSATEKMFGYLKGELLKKNVQDLLPPRLKPLFLEARKTLTEQPNQRKSVGEQDSTMIKKNGEEFAVEVDSNLITSSQGDFVISTIIDMSERKQTEERYRLYVDGILDYALTMLDVDGKIVSWNLGAERNKGYTANEIIGKSFEIFYGPEDLANGTPKKDLEAAKTFGRSEGEGWRYRKDGSRFWANVILSAIRDSAGNLRGYAKLTRDLSERRNQEERFRSIFEGVPAGLILTNEMGQIVLCNSELERIFGYCRFELMNKSVELLVPKKTEELKGRRKDGTEVYIEIGINPIHLEQGTFTLTSVVDITARKEIENNLHTIYQALDQRNKEMEQFTYVVSHDLQVPLVSISGFTNKLRDYRKNIDPEEQRFFDRIFHNIRKSENLLKDLLNLSRVQQQMVELKETELLEVIQDAFSSLELQLKENKIDFSFPNKGTKIYCNRERLTQVFENLIKNAIIHMGKVDHPRIEVGFKELQGQPFVECFVKDNGHGIPLEYHTKAFKIFERFSPDKNSGTGIGLSICRSVIEKQGGTIRLESDVGKGAAFYFTVPTKKG